MRIAFDLFARGEPHAENFAQLFKIGLDEPGAVLQYVHEQRARRIHRNAQVVPAGRREQAGVKIARNALRNAAREHETGILRQGGDLLRERPEHLLRERGAAAVYIRLPRRFELDVDAGEPVRAEKIRRHAARFQHFEENFARKPCRDAHREGGHAEIFEHERDVDALAARRDALAVRTVDRPFAELIQPHRIVQRGIAGQRIDHLPFSPPDGSTPSSERYSSRMPAAAAQSAGQGRFL